jgi:prepilin-type N-terminal cleavage/methylation domain-containing protein
LIFGDFIMRKQSSLKGFTLIELLVVIAIIAILAAILFPVFAQAKTAAKKAAAISQSKQAGTAILLYTADVDDMGPTGTVPDLASAIQRFKPAVFTMMSPAGWFVNPVIENEHALIWHNSTEPYRKNYDMLNMPGTNPVAIAGWPAGAIRTQPRGSNLTYNGLLQNYSMSAIEASSICPLLWQGFGNITRTGAASTNPRLNCAGTGPCAFNPSGPPQADMAAGSRGDVFNILFRGESSYYVYGQTIVFVASDSSAKVIKPGNGNRAGGNLRLNTVWPIQFIEADGTVLPTNNFIRGWLAGNPSSLYVAGFVPVSTYAY